MEEGNLKDRHCMRQRHQELVILKAKSSTFSPRGPISPTSPLPLPTLSPPPSLPLSRTQANKRTHSRPQIIRPCPSPITRSFLVKEMALGVCPDAALRLFLSHHTLSTIHTLPLPRDPIPAPIVCFHLLLPICPSPPPCPCPALALVLNPRAPL